MALTDVMPETAVTQTVAVGPQWSTAWRGILWGVVFAALLGGCALLIAGQAFGLICLTIATVLATGIVIATAWLNSQQREVHIGTDFFVVEGRRGTVRVVDRDVDALSLGVKPWHSAGCRVGEKQRVRFWIEDGRGLTTLEVRYRVPLHEPDPLGELKQRLCAALLDRAHESLRRGESIEAAAWSLDPDRLRVHTDAGEAEVGLDEVTTIERRNGRLLLWRGDETRPFAQLDDSDRNHWMLPLLLPDAGSVRATPATEPQLGLGRLLFEYRATRMLPMVLAAVGGLFISLFAVLLYAAIVRQSLLLGMIASLMLMITLPITIAAVRLRNSVLASFEHGLKKSGFLGEQEIRYDEIGVMAFDARRQFSRGRYTGTTIVLVCTLADRGQPGRDFFYATTLPHLDDNWEDLRERIATAIVRRMAARLADGELVQWTPELWIAEDCLIYRPKTRLFGRRKACTVHYSSITQFQEQGSLFHIWTNAQERAAISVRLSSPNFYPGLLLFETLCERYQPTILDEWHPPLARDRDDVRADHFAGV